MSSSEVIEATRSSDNAIELSPENNSIKDQTFSIWGLPFTEEAYLRPHPAALDSILGAPKKFSLDVAVIY